jgi:hypothetical protein
MDSLVSALFGGVIVALINYYLNKRAMEASIEKTKEETKKIHTDIERAEAETARIRVETEVLKGKVNQEIERVEVTQTKQGQDIKLLRFFIANFIGKFEWMHLEGLEKGRPYPFDRVSPEFVQELVHLRSSGLIEHFDGKGIVAMQREGKGDLHDHFRITDLGREYLKLRRQIESEAETEAAKAKP